MVLDVNAMTTASDEDDDSKYNVPSSRPCTAASGHIYNNSWASSIEIPKDQKASGSGSSDWYKISADWINGTKESSEARDKFLDQNHHYVNGYAFRQAQQPMNEMTTLAMTQHNLTYVNRPNTIMNKCYDFNLSMPRMLETQRELQVNEDYI